ncbi:MAG: polyribonucleotide nucleotidyltransferase [Muribaculaceae bacterium]|nr:polyribonucleotide nucleotidyltransferase [Bacteroidales bacterium]MDD6942947.1 polyribonucleotide nucleotidyltransferase [Bacteroidales bacterium]MDY2733366.1 polyribonucleotide nucleotidyltransferase [Muribaculaceae bacterium]MDY4649168.1 polyribonucleotide nucleotidyltransferase [Muribaculaceae bacterium]
MLQPVKKTITLPDGREITIETGKLAKQADGAVEVRMGNTMLLATVCSAQEAGEGVDFMPLTVEYKEKYASIGRYPGGFQKREGRASDYEILTSRLVDRVLRPLFPEDYHADTFVNVILFSADEHDAPDALAGIAASAALACSDIPFNGPISEVRVARVGGEWVINPTFEQIEEADIELMVGATYDNIMMVEGEMNEVSEAELLEALKVAHAEIKKHCVAQIELMKEAGKETKRVYCHEINDEELRKDVHDKCYDKAYAIARTGTPDKHWRAEQFDKICEEYIEQLPEMTEADLEKYTADQRIAMVKRYYHDVEKEAMRRCVLDEGIRLDGRKTTEIRPIWCEVDYLPGPHGAAVFTRGETQALVTTTLGTTLDEKIVDDVLNQSKERFLLHYNFPPFSTGEARPQRGVGRREIGHGNLAHRALKRMLPDNFPYTCRIVSDILESNGSSSMATVCGGTLSLLDAGVKMKRPVAGVAMGLISDKDNVKYAILSDILGDEDHLGDMDFKVTGTTKGITATQMDIKCDGLSYEVLERALNQARDGRLHILNIINETIPAPREDYKPHVPRLITIEIPKDMIGAVIGPQGKVIQGIQEETGATISIDEDEKLGIGRVEIASKDKASIDAALAKIKAIVAQPEEGEVYEGTVRSILDFGAFVEFMPGRDGLLHISEISWDRLENMEASGLKEGDKVNVKLIEIDKKTGKYRLSMRVLTPKPEGYVERESRPRREGGDRGPRPRRDGDRGPRQGGDRGPRQGGQRTFKHNND